MFVDKLDTEQKGVFLDLAEQLIRADNVVSEAEAGKMEELHALFPGVGHRHVTDDELKKVFPGKAERVAILLELTSIACLSKKAVRQDMAFIDRTARILAVSERDMGKIVMLVRQMLTLVGMAQELMLDEQA